MESLLVYPQNEVQLKALKAILKALKIPFETELIKVPPHISKSIETSISQYESGQTISLEEFTEKHFITRVGKVSR